MFTPTPKNLTTLDQQSKIHLKRLFLVILRVIFHVLRVNLI